jgi:methionyl-tRNA formyltransferase
MSKPRILFMGTPAFAVPSLGILLQNNYPLLGVVTQPDRGKGRGQKPAPSPVKVLAESRGLPILQPERLKHEDFLAVLREMRPDAIVVAAFGQILPPAVLEGPRGDASMCIRPCSRATAARRRLTGRSSGGKT